MADPIKPEDIKPGDWVRYRDPAFVRDSIEAVEATGDWWVRTALTGRVLHRAADVLEVRRG